MSAPARTSVPGISPGQIVQLIQLLRKLSQGEVQRLLRNGDLLLLIAKVPASEDSAVRLRQYASGYVPMVYFYKTNAHGMKGWVRYSDSWVVQTGPDKYEPWLEHYGLEYAEEGPGAELIKEAVLHHWGDYEAWYVQVN
jgi:hypothetical protein